MEGTWVAILPFMIVIVAAIATKQVFPGLVLGLVVGAYMVEPTFLGGIQQTVNYIVDSLTDINNLKIIIFLYLFSGLVGIIKVSGGIKGFVQLTAEKIDSKKEALLLTWASTLGTFSAPSFRIVTVAPIMKALLQKIHMTRRELAFMIETSTQPVIVLIPIATALVGYMVSVIQMGLQNQNIDAEPYALFIQSIPFNFFAISMIIIGTLFVLLRHSKEKTNEDDDRDPNKVQEDKENHATADDLPSKPWNLIVPVVLVIVLTLILTWWDGYSQGYGFFEAFIEADVLQAMVVALFITVLVTFIVQLAQNNTLKEMIPEFISSGNNLMSVILLLSVVWALSLVTEDLGLSEFVTNNVSWIPTMFIPPVIFLIGGFISYFIGSSWGTWGILMPLGISLAHAGDASLTLVIGAVFASGSFGSITSPLSDNNITIAEIMGMNPLKYARYKLVPASIAVAISTILYGVIAMFF
ncbi:putative Na+/H+ antiporter family protein [Gracilibacillus halophilus YIM-C55.5]|uniref:Putative Na+/H+ antiporter family protein n=1 Tax=Gracilibacillus halophilus YIM-C55.5 TaxID=1308866 RepID=N4WVE6_9BACI|nr:Na+/H+ antiporter NhaC family protein [Gracilibacillus halophilus]ENH98365.1 putative Na+/H+ antiporter family protein [Gracilibacillus halophilus YIM-C55.5]